MDIFMAQFKGMVKQMFNVMLDKVFKGITYSVCSVMYILLCMFVLYTLYFVKQCVVYSLQSTDCYVQYVWTMQSVQCIVFSELYTVHYVLCTVFYVQYVVE